MSGALAVIPSADNWLERAEHAFLSRGIVWGDLLTHDWLEWALETNQSGDRLMWLQRFDAFRELLIDRHKVHLQSVYGVGYRIVPPKEQAELAARTAAHFIDKGLRKGGRLLEKVRHDELTDADARRHTDATVRMAGLKQILQRPRRELLSAVRQAPESNE